jgi:hypothetical protein
MPQLSSKLTFPNNPALKANNAADANRFAGLMLFCNSTEELNTWATVEAANVQNGLPILLEGQWVRVTSDPFGDLYFWNGTDTFVSFRIQGGDLQSLNNLSDLDNIATARNNLGLGTAATKNVGTTAADVAAGDTLAIATDYTDTEISALSTALQAVLNLKLNIADYSDRFKGVYISEAALQAALPTSSAGDYAQVDPGTGTALQTYSYDLQEGWVPSSADGSGAQNTDQLPEGAANLYFTSARAIAAAPAETTTSIGTLINGAIEKTTPVDSDLFNLVDSAASYIIKKLTFANLKTAILGAIGISNIPANVRAYDIHIPFIGTPVANQIFTIITFARAVKFPAGVSGSNGKVLTTNATSTYEITLTIYNSSGVSQASGSVSIATNGVFTFVWNSDYTTSANDYLVASGGTADATLKDFTFTFVGEVQ